MRRWSGVVDVFRQDFAIALRRLRKAPGSSATVVVTLALGIGANLTMFRVIDRVLLRPPEHVQDAHRVVRMFQRSLSPGEGRVEFKPSMAYPDFADLDGASFFAASAAYAFDNPVVGDGENAERVLSQWATAGLFPLLGVKPALGRLFTDREDRAASSGTAVLAWSYWKRRFGGDHGVLGEDLRIGASSYTIIGVAPAGFTGPSLEPVQVWLPLHTTAAIEAGSGWDIARGWMWIQIVARLAPGVSRDVAQAQANALKQSGWAAESPSRERSLVLTSLMAADEPEVPTWAAVSMWLAGISALVWAIAVANVANILLAREIRRRRETAVRLALGVTRARLLGQFLTEALLLASLAAAAGALVAEWGGQVVGTILLPGLAFESAGQGGRILIFTLATCLLTAVLAGLVPVLQAGRRDVAEELKARARVSPPRSRLQDGLVVAQGGLSVVMLVFAGLFMRSLQGVESRTHVGIDHGPLVLAQIFLEPGQEGHAEATQIYRAAVDRVGRLPWVQNVTAATYGPFAGSRGVQIRVPGRGELLHALTVNINGPDQVHVTPEFFLALGVQIVRGRGFLPSDDATAAAQVGVISQSMAEHFWPGEDPRGECMWVEADEACTTIVGVSSDIRWNGLGWPASLILYLPLGQRQATPRDLLVRVAGDPADYLMTLRRELRAVSPRVRFVGVRPLSGLVAGQAAPWRLGARMCLLFGSLALVVAGVGLYSLMAFRVAQGRHEIALRGALGASRPRITGMIVRDGLMLVVSGVSIGLVIAALSSRWIEPLLVKVSGLDPLVYGIVATTLVLVGLLASLLPARRATRVDPVRVLNAE